MAEAFVARPLVLDLAVQLVPDLQKVLGPLSEVLVHDLRFPEHSVIAIAGHLTGRSIGAPATDLLLRLTRQNATDVNPLNYNTWTSDGRKMRSSTIFLRDSAAGGEVIGALCINVDVSVGEQLQQWVRENVIMPGDEPAGLQNEPVERFDTSVEETMRAALARVLGEIGKKPAELSKAERLRVVEALDQVGVFLIKNSTAFVADALGISRATLYNYVNQVRGIPARRQEDEILTVNAEPQQPHCERVHEPSRKAGARKRRLGC